MSQSAPSLIRQFLAGFDWSGRTPRSVYALTLVALCALLWAVSQSIAFSVAHAVLCIVLAVTFFAALGHTRRRLRDVGWHGAWMLLLLVPGAALILPIVLCLREGDKDAGTAPAGYSRLGFALAACAALLVASRAIWAPYTIPAGSMKPALLVGDYVLVSRAGTPKRGDVLVFRHPLTRQDFIKRLIGMPGDRVQMRAGALILNDTPLPRKADGNFTEPMAFQGPFKAMPRCANQPVERGKDCLKEQWIETLPSGKSYATLNISETRSDTTAAFLVPPEHYFFMGDNRDNSLDSRWPQDMRGLGFVPAANVVGQARRIVFSAQGTAWPQFWTWRADRFWWRVR